MVRIYQAKAKSLGPSHQTLLIERWDHEAQSIAFHAGKICFIEGGLPGETVKVQLTEQKAQYAKGHVQAILTPSPLRIKAQCPVAGQCGGCQLHHIGANEALKLKQQAVAELLHHQLKISDLPWQQPIVAQAQGYRRKARIGIWYDKPSQQYQVGFRKNQSNEILDVDACLVLSPTLAKVLPVLRQTLPKLKNGSAITHAEVVDADGQAFIILRHIKALPEQDRELLKQSWPEAYWFGEAEPGEFSAWQQHTPQTQYGLVLPNKQSITLTFSPGDFIQINTQVNQQMVQQAIDWLEPCKDDRILDLYCGIGNFSLALAAMGAAVVGVEGVDAMVQRASANAKLNDLSTCEFYQADLHLPWPKAGWSKANYNKILLDPARAGAAGAIDEIAKLKAAQILYVSCNPTTFARDAKVLLAKGFRIAKIGVMDMFPYTSHLELMALFTK